MTKKTFHGLETCEDCRKIVLQFLDPDFPSIRFNFLLRKCRETIDPKYSAPRLQRHLEAIEGKLIRREKTGSQEVKYSLTIPEGAKLEELRFDTDIERLKDIPLAQLINLKLDLYRFAGLQQIKADLEILLNKVTPEANSFRVGFLKVMMACELLKIDKAMTGRSKDEYQTELKELKDGINALRLELS